MQKFLNFKYVNNLSSDSLDIHSVYFLNEAHQIVPQSEAKRAVVKKRNALGGFKEFFIVLKNPNELDVEKDYPIPNLHLEEIEEDNGVDPYYIYGLDKILYLKEKDKNVPIFTDHSFVELVPKKFGNIERTLDEICASSSNNRQTIYKHYKTLNPNFVDTLLDVNTTTVAYLYEYLNDGKKWKEGMEFIGYCDGLFLETTNVFVTIDTPEFSNHTSTHELGHAVSFFLKQDLFDEYIEIATNKNEEPPTEYAKTECSEDFAESFGFYFSTEISDKDAFEKMCPSRYAYMAKIEKLGSNALLNELNPTSELVRRFQEYNIKPWKT